VSRGGTHASRGDQTRWSPGFSAEQGRSAQWVLRRSGNSFPSHPPRTIKRSLHYNPLNHRFSRKVPPPTTDVTAKVSYSLPRLFLTSEKASTKAIAQTGSHHGLWTHPTPQRLASVRGRRARSSVGAAGNRFLNGFNPSTIPRYRIRSMAVDLIARYCFSSAPPPYSRRSPPRAGQICLPQFTNSRPFRLFISPPMHIYRPVSYEWRLYTAITFTFARTLYIVFPASTSADRRNVRKQPRVLAVGFLKIFLFFRVFVSTMR